MKIIEQIIAIEIKNKNEKYLLIDLIPFLCNKIENHNVVFSKSEYDVFINSKRVREIFDTHKVITTTLPETIPNTIFKGSFTDRNKEYVHIYVENN